MSVCLVSTWIHIRRASSQWSASILLGGALPLSGSCPLGWGEGVGDCHDAADLQKVFLFPLCTFLSEKTMLLLSMLVTKREPTPGYNDAYSVGTLTKHFGGKAGRCTVRPHFLPCLDVFFWLANGPFYLWVRLVVWMPHIGRAQHQTSCSW